MNKLAYLLTCLLLLAFSSACFGEMAGMQQKIAALLAQKDFSRLRFGICITDAGGKTLFSHNENAKLIPASNQKLLVGACGLLHFGPNYRFKTRFYKKGRIENGTLRGNLVVRGTGAIAFTSRYIDDFEKKKEVLERQLDAFVNRIKRAGIARIEGEVIVDGSTWSGMACNRQYPAAGSVTFNENAVEIQVAGTRIHTIPETVFHFKLVSGGGTAHQAKILENGKPTDTILINTGTDSMDYWRIDTISAEEYYKKNIVHALEQRGITISGTDCTRPAGEELLFDLEGIPVSEYVHRMFTDSDNVRAELLFLNLGYSLYGKANYENGGVACKALLKKNGLLPENCTIADGSGLSPNNKLSAKNLTRLLLFMNTQKNREIFRSSLAVSGRTGTIQDTFSAQELTGRIQGKSGTMDDALTLSGFAETEKGEVVFSFLANHVDDRKKIWKLYEDILLCLMKYGCEGQPVGSHAYINSKVQTSIQITDSTGVKNE
jgi:D-alanyl-D-alanine carboxypeptidase/D-alanyl-D-alanine-endopeptidase (penicillin-binding protein 4)